MCTKTSNGPAFSVGRRLFPFWIGLWFLIFSALSAGSYANEPDSSQGSSKHPIEDTEFPGRATEVQQAEAKQAEAKEEAFKSLLVRGPYTFIPLPAFTYNRNERYWIGGLVPILKANPKGDLQDIFAPQYLHNPSVGETMSLSYFGYPSDTEQYNATASYSTKIQRDIDLNYKNVAAGGGRYILAGRATWFKNAFRRFFGIGNEAQEANETNYTSREALVELTAGIHLNEDIALLWSERYHEVHVDKGAVTSLPATQTVFPQLIGLGGAQIVGHRLTFRYDTRDRQLIPTRGSYVTVAGELSQNLSHPEPHRWWRTTIDARHYIPHASDRMVFVAHFLADTVNGRAIPFYELPTLGGETTLRAFGQSRFIDDTALLVNFEERILFKERQIFDYQLGFEIAPFIDIGRVESRFSLRDIDNLQFNPGVGLRVLARPHVIGRLDLAYGRNGTNVFVGLDYPF